MESLFSLDAQLLFNVALLAISVFVLFTVLSYLLFEPARKLLEKRKGKIEKDLETATTNREEAKNLKTKYKSKLKTANKEAEEILRQSRQNALRNEAIIIEEARAEVADMKAHAKKEIALEKVHAQDDMKNEMIALASLLAEKVVSASMNIKIQDSLVEETLNEMSERTWGN